MFPKEQDAYLAGCKARLSEIDFSSNPHTVPRRDFEEQLMLWEAWRRGWIYEDRWLVSLADVTHGEPLNRSF